MTSILITRLPSHDVTSCNVLCLKGATALLYLGLALEGPQLVLGGPFLSYGLKKKKRVL